MVPETKTKRQLQAELQARELQAGLAVEERQLQAREQRLAELAELAEQVAGERLERRRIRGIPWWRWRRRGYPPCSPPRSQWALRCSRSRNLQASRSWRQNPKVKRGT